MSSASVSAISAISAFSGTSRSQVSRTVGPTFSYVRAWKPTIDADGIYSLACLIRASQCMSFYHRPRGLFDHHWLLPTWVCGARKVVGWMSPDIVRCNKLRSSSPGGANIDMGIRRKGYQNLRQFAHCRGDVSVGVKRDAYWHIGTCNGTQPTQNLTFAIVAEVCDHRAVKHQKNAIPFAFRRKD